MVQASEEYENNAAIVCDHVPLFEDATTTIPEDIKEACHWVSGKNPCNTETTVHTASKIFLKKTKLVAFTAALTPVAGAVQAGEKVPRKPECERTEPDCEDEGDDRGKKKAHTLDKKFSMKNGAFFAKSGFRDTLDLRLSKIYCTKFNRLLIWCDRKICKLKHVPVFHFQPDKMTTQIEYVEFNKSKVCFNSAEARFFPMNKKHLLGNPYSGDNLRFFTTSVTQ